MQNVGQGKVEFKASESVYVNNIQVGITSPIQPLALGETAALETNKVISEGEKVEIKVTTTSGISVTTTGIASTNPTATPNVAPVLAAIGNKNVNEGVLLTFTASATDADLPAQTLTYSATGLPSGATFNAATRTFSWTPSESQGGTTPSITLRVTDNGVGLLYDEETITVTVSEVNSAPVLAAIGNKNVNEGVLLTFTASATDADLPAQTLTYSATGLPSGASISGAGIFSWTPAISQGSITPYQITVRVTDDGTGALFDEETIAVTVAEVNTAPALDVISAKSVNEGSLLTVTPVASDVDVPAQTLTFSLQGTVPAGVAIDSATGVMTWTPSESQGGTAPSITIRVSDSGTPSLFAERTFIVTVDEVNVAPVLAIIGSKSVNEGVQLTFTASATDVDLPAQVLTYSATGLPSGASFNVGTRTFSWIPSESQGGTAPSITIRVTDNGVGLLYDEETIVVTVGEVNVAPVLAAIGSKSVNEGVQLTFTASATDIDIPAQTLTFSLDTGEPAGTMITTGGVFTWTPTGAQGSATPYSFTVRVTDNGSPAQNDFETITIVVADTGTGLISDGFEATGNAWNDNWDGNGNTNWYQSTTQFHSGTYSARSNNWNEGDLISDNLDTSGNPATHYRIFLVLPHKH